MKLATCVSTCTRVRLLTAPNSQSRIFRSSGVTRESYALCRDWQTIFMSPGRQTRERGWEQRRRRAVRTEGHSVDWHTARRAADATATRRVMCERRDRQQYGPNARGWAAREPRARLATAGENRRLCRKATAGGGPGVKGFSTQPAVWEGGPKLITPAAHLATLRGRLAWRIRVLAILVEREYIRTRCCRRPNDCRISCNAASHATETAARRLLRLEIGPAGGVPPASADC